MKIILLEDSDYQAQVYIEYLTNMNHDVTHYWTGMHICRPSGVEIVNEADCLISDIVMLNWSWHSDSPKSGIEVFRYLMARKCEKPILAHSGKDRHKDHKGEVDLINLPNIFSGLNIKFRRKDSSSRYNRETLGYIDGFLTEVELLKMET